MACTNYCSSNNLTQLIKSLDHKRKLDASILENKYEEMQEYRAFQAGLERYYIMTDASRAGADGISTIEDQVADYHGASDSATALFLGTSIIIAGLCEMVATGISRK